MDMNKNKIKVNKVNVCYDKQGRKHLKRRGGGLGGAGDTLLFFGLFLCLH